MDAEKLKRFEAWGRFASRVYEIKDPELTRLAKEVGLPEPRILFEVDLTNVHPLTDPAKAGTHAGD